MKIHDIRDSDATPKEKLKKAIELWDAIEKFLEGKPAEEQLQFESMINETLSISIDLHNMATLGYNPYKNYEDLPC